LSVPSEPYSRQGHGAATAAAANQMELTELVPNFADLNRYNIRIVQQLPVFGIVFDWLHKKTSHALPENHQVRSQLL
jgi:hypothetical protein